MSASSPMPASGGFTAAVQIVNPAKTLIVRGVVALAFGLLALIWPTITVLVLAIVFGIYAFVDGVMRIVDAVRDRDRARRWVPVLSGVLSVAVGIASLIWPGITVIALALLVGAWALVTGVTEIVAAVRQRQGGFLLGLLGLISVVAGVLVLFQPIAGALGIALVIGVYAVIYGGMLFALGYRARKLVNA